MSSGLFALLDDVAAIAKVAAASLDDVAAATGKASSKAIGIVIDDTAVTPRYVVGFAADRELPIIGRIALGSLKNKMLILLPGALALSLVAPWAITPLLMLGGAYLAFEGFEKAMEWVRPHGDHAEAASTDAPVDPKELEDEKVESAIRTDMILSAEIMAIALAGVAAASFWTQAIVLAAVGLLITGLVYGLVALIVKADDLGVALARRDGPVSRRIGRMLVNGMPPFLAFLGVLGTVAMLWVGGGIILHGLAGMGVPGPEYWLQGVARAIAAPFGGVGPIVDWFVNALGGAVVGLALGAVIAPIVEKGVKPAWKAFRTSRKTV